MYGIFPHAIFFIISKSNAHLQHGGPLLRSLLRKTLVKVKKRAATIHQVKEYDEKIDELQELVDIVKETRILSRLMKHAFSQGRVLFRGIHWMKSA